MDQLISSLQNPTIKHLTRMRDNRARRKAGRILVDGWRETRRAIHAGLTLRAFYFADPENQNGDSDQSWVLSNSAEDAVFVSSAVMQKISYGQSERGVVAEFEAPKSSLQNLRIPADALVLVLDQFEKPGNIGAAFRCADAVGADAVLVTPSNVDRFNPNAIRSSLGAVFTIPSASCGEEEARQWLAEKQVDVIAARVESSKPLWQIDLRGPVAIVIGSEANGLGRRWASSSQWPVQSARIPMSGDVDSLNASVSAALLLYEARRQRS